MPEIEKTLRVFISHSSKDHSIARELYLQLIAEGWMEVWFIESNLKPSQNWDAEIRAAVEKADVVIALLSKNSTKKEEHIYPDPHFIFDTIESRSGGDVLLIPLQLDNSIDLEESEVIVYFPKKHRRLIYSQILAKLKSHAIQQGFSTDVVVREPESEQRLQWSPTKWRELGSIFGGEVIDDESFESKPVGPTPKWKSSLFTGASKLLYFSLTAILVFVVTAIGLAINFINTGETVNDLAEPVISRVLTLVPLPTPTLGVGSVRVSPVDGMRMVYVPEGEFSMGSDDYQDDEKPVHNVYLDAFWIDQYEVTNGMYAKCIVAKLCSVPIPDGFSVTFFDSDSDSGQMFFRYLAEQSDFFDQLATNPEFFSQPVTSLFWENANAYCHWAGRRLPTEAEWEKAARGVDGRTYPWGEKIDCTKANFFSCVDNPSRIGSYEAGQSPYGVYDMAGNAMEWVADWYGKTYYQDSPYENPLGPESGLYRVFRGSSWGSDIVATRSANRPGLIAHIPTDFIGFRCALSE